MTAGVYRHQVQPTHQPPARQRWTTSSELGSEDRGGQGQLFGALSRSAGSRNAALTSDVWWAVQDLNL